MTLSIGVPSWMQEHLSKIAKEPERFGAALNNQPEFTSALILLMQHYYLEGVQSCLLEIAHKAQACPDSEKLVKEIANFSLLTALAVRTAGDQIQSEANEIKTQIKGARDNES